MHIPNHTHNASNPTWGQSCTKFHETKQHIHYSGCLVWRTPLASALSVWLKESNPKVMRYFEYADIAHDVWLMYALQLACSGQVQNWASVSLPPGTRGVVHFISPDELVFKLKWIKSFFFSNETETSQWHLTFVELERKFWVWVLLHARGKYCIFFYYSTSLITSKVIILPAKMFHWLVD